MKVFLLSESFWLFAPVWYLDELFLLLGFARQEMTLPSDVKLPFICFASSKRIPFECVLFTRSDPARSTRTRRPFRYSSYPWESYLFLVWYTSMCRTVWERLDVSFILRLAIYRWISPAFTIFMAWSSVSTGTSTRSPTKTSSPSYLMLKFFDSGLSKSDTCSR